MTSRSLMMSSRSTTLRSSRMLPRQRAWRSASSAPGENRAGRRLFSRLNCATKCCTSAGMSSSALAQRRHGDRNDAQPEVEILAEPALRDFLFEVLVRRRNDADVDLDRPRRSEPLDFAFLQHAQHLGLRLGAHVADFVEEDRAAVGHLELADLLLGRAGERAALVAEELRLDQLFGNRRAVDLHEPLLRAQAAR